MASSSSSDGEIDNNMMMWMMAVMTSECTQHNLLAWSLFIAASLWLAMILFYWSHPGGHAWGKHYFSLLSTRTRTTPIMIPGPKGWPLLGSITLMASLAHRRIAAAATTCKASRLMAFSMGDSRAIVTCHPDVAKQILNNPAFADRPHKESAYGLMFNRSIGFAPYGLYWRTLRRIAATHLFSPKQIKASEFQRSEIAAEMVDIFKKSSGTGQKLRVREVLKRASLSNMMWSVFGQHCSLNGEDGETEELRELVEEGYDLLGILNWADHLPWLAPFDAQKIRFRCRNLVPKVSRFLSRIIAHHKTQTNRDFLDVLLSLPETDRLSHSDMIAVLWEMIFRGTDTVAVLMEWIMARMVLHPDVQSKVQDELDRVVGTSRALVEDDVSSMTYLPAVVKEVLRMHPPGPLLSWARMSISDTTVDGYEVPAGTTALVNMWAIARDPRVWKDPLEFMPDRFLDSAYEDFSILGSDLRLAPFGSGKRACPGKALGMATVTFWVASLLHHFQWLPSDEVDLSEVLRLSSEMAQPLTVKLRPRRTLPY